MNQFAIDKAGFTRYMLSPLSDRRAAAGQGCRQRADRRRAGGVLLRRAGARLSRRQPGAVAGAALLGDCDLRRSSRRRPPRCRRCSRARSISTASATPATPTRARRFSACCLSLRRRAPCALLVFVATRLLDRPQLAPVFCFAWCAVAFVIARLLFIPVRRLVASRCEALAQY